MPSISKITTIIAITVIKLALQAGVFRNIIPKEQAAIMAGIQVNTTVLYSLKVLSEREISASINVETSWW